jgi:hypothetical protein
MGPLVEGKVKVSVVIGTFAKNGCDTGILKQASRYSLTRKKKNVLLAEDGRETFLML